MYGENYDAVWITLICIAIIGIAFIIEYYFDI